MHRVRWYRRYDRLAASAAAVILVVGAATACSSGSRQSEVTTETSTDHGSLEPRCGELLNWIPTDAPLSMRPQFPQSARTDGDGMLRGIVTVTNRTGATLSATTAAQPDLVLLRDERVVTLPIGLRAVAVNVDLEPGASMDFDAAASLRSCESGPYPAGTPLPSGSYQLVASQTFNIVGPDGSIPIAARGGRWEVTLS